MFGEANTKGEVSLPPAPGAEAALISAVIDTLPFDGQMMAA
jgi:hypothetical protein